MGTFGPGIDMASGFSMKVAKPVDQDRDQVATFDDLLTLPKCFLGIEVKVADQEFKKYVWFQGEQNNPDNWKVASGGGAEDFHIPFQFVATNMDGEYLAEFDFSVTGSSFSEKVTEVRVYINDVKVTAFPAPVTAGQVVRVGMSSLAQDKINLVNLKCKRS
ncbi:hypothetical protein FUAX_55840 (plasmid) [Fulvitalea axinellae]|uniref:Uncharacterized protein n=1 Tax=Fulvitalea axinellae TaxID=1182444 RepID=A0AAU9CZI3_9BACT|nr:hypothetical protein FUAX_55840 [Fulvitalea axinellae]